MTLKNINQTLREPEHYRFEGVRAEGAFLIAAYSQKLLKTGTNLHLGTRWIHIYVNDQGREVIRTEDNFIPAPEPMSLRQPPPKPLTWDERLVKWVNKWSLC